ncbi:MAG TPA: TolC family protein [Dongiaceae bacterium]|jgi:outer membrane protein TolC|nr:TolC family protein [Dongiaceae bacterium]
MKASNILRAKRAPVSILAALSCFSFLHASAVAQEVPGQTLDSLIEIARKLSPDVAARTLDAAAAQARVEQADSLPDPTITLNSDEIDRTGGPRQGKLYYGFSQEIPLWGKRTLRRDIARAEFNRDRATIKESEAELTERVSAVFADYYQASQAIALLDELHRASHDIAAQARMQYAQGLGEQKDVYKAEVDTAAVAQERNKFETMRSRAMGLLNILLNRPARAALAVPNALPPVPPAETLEIGALVERALKGNPSILAAQAATTGAASERELARKNWYPDLTLSAYGIDRGENGPPGYSASISFKVPLEWGMHEAEESAASAKLGASRAREDAALRQIQENLIEAASALEGARREETILRQQVLPNAEASFTSARTAYAVNRASLTAVLTAQHDLAHAQLDLLAIQVDERRQLAVIERLIGGRL